MGRRKIEIQPITHERNRSVTFLKRKNGLFKKAYELGVLCSVEVAVIIFEEKPGHGSKCYQYGSDDVKSIIQRHVRFEGEKDSKSPSDFSNSKAGDVVDGEEDEVDEEEETIVTHSKKRSDSGSIKPPGHKSKVEVKVEASGSRTIDIADHHPTPSHSRPTQSPADQSRSLSNSGDRMSKHSSDDPNDHPAHKRPRLGYSEDVRAAEARAFNAQGLAPYGYHPSLHPLPPQGSAGGHASSLPLYNGATPIGGQSSAMFDLFRNPGNMRAFSHMYPARPPPNVSEAFLASLNEVAQQGGVGCGIGGVGGGMSSFEWSSGYTSGNHHGDQPPDSSWLDLLTGGSSNNGPPPAHVSPPHGQNHHQQWSSASSSRSDSSMSGSGLPLGLSSGGGGVLPPRLSVGSNRPSSAEIMDTKGIL